VLQQQFVVRYQQSNNYLPPALQQLLSLSLTMLAVMQPAAFYSLKMPPWPVWQPIAFPAIRAIVGSDTTTVADSITRCAANLVILNPSQFSLASMAQIAKELTTRMGNPPKILAAAHVNTSHGDCSCQNP
jgi:hypothetical protein